MTAVLAVAIVGVIPGAGARAQETAPPLIVGAWTLNRDASDHPEDRSSDDGDGGDRRGGGRRGGGGFGRGGFGGGGRGGGGRGGRGGDGRGGLDPDQVARIRDATRDIMNPPEHLTIVRTENMIIITGPDGRTTRLSPDGKKIKDESTKLERKTKWDGPTLVSEITGLPGTKITESYSVEPERHQLHVTVKSDNQRRPLTVHRVYDADTQ
jgi:hypothetical protein